MGDYHATWEIDVTADDPVAAARAAQADQRRIGTWASVFDVTDDSGKTERVDLAELDGPETPLQATLKDWRFGDEDYERDTPAALKGEWAAKITGNAGGLDILLTAPDGTTRTVWLEIENGDLRVRVYGDETVSDEPAGELRLAPGVEQAEAVFE